MQNSNKQFKRLSYILDCTKIHVNKKHLKLQNLARQLKINIFKKLFAQTFKCISHSALQFNSCTLTITLNGIKTQHKKHNYEKAPQHIV